MAWLSGVGRGSLGIIKGTARLGEPEGRLPKRENEQQKQCSRERRRRRGCQVERDMRRDHTNRARVLLGRGSVVVRGFDDLDADKGKQ